MSFLSTNLFLPFIIISGSKSPFDKNWWEKNTGIDSNVQFIDDIITGTRTLPVNVNTSYVNRALIDGTGIARNSRIVVPNGTAVLTMDNCHIQPYVSTGIAADFFTKIIVRHCENKSPYSKLYPAETWEETLPDQNAFAQGSIDISYSRINSLLDGVVGRNGTSEMPVNIYRNWIRGPGKIIGTRHMDGIQVIVRGYTNIQENRIEGWDNSGVFIKGGGIAPIDGSTDPIQHVNIKGNFFGNSGLSYFYIFCRIGDAGINQSTYGARPRYVTITGNFFESHMHETIPGRRLDPILSGDNATNPSLRPAMFVHTESERYEGIMRQDYNPDVLSYRQSVGYDITAVDARTWIVWNNNIWLDDNTEAIPPLGWYDISKER